MGNISSKKTATFTIDSNLLEAFETSRGYFKKSTLVSYWIQSFLDNKREFVPPRNKPVGSKDTPDRAIRSEAT